MKITESKTISSIQEVTIGYKCDCCNTTINAKYFPDHWHQFSGHHNSWGNDSIDSYEDYEACSPKCYFELLEKSIKEFGSYCDAEIDEFSIDFVKELVKHYKIKGE